MAALGVNKAADQFVVLDERTEREMASGRYKRQPEAGGTHRTSSATPRRRTGTPRTAPDHVPSLPARPRPWSEARENLAVISRGKGMRPDQIAKKLGVSPYFVTQILLDTTARGRR